MSDCVDETHFQEIDGVITPQPWMQWRNVGAIVAPSRAASYGVTLGAGVGGVNVFGTLGTLFGSMFSSLTGIFGLSSVLAGLAPSVSAAGNKNQLVHSLQRSWHNNTPVDQWVYGLITRGGCRVTLQARSRGGLVTRSGSKTQWQSRTDFDHGGAGMWSLGGRVTLAEVDDTWSMQIAGGAGPAQSIIDNVPVGPGDRVTVTFRARRDAAYNGTATNSKLRLVSQSSAGLASANFDTTVLASPNVWYSRAISYTVPASGVTALRFQMVSDAAAGNVYIDDILIDIGRGGPPDAEIVLTDASMFGIGGDIGRGGTLAVGTDFAVLEQRMNSVTFPLTPERAGWVRLPPGEIFTARVELRFISEFWENTTIDGGDSGTEASFESGDTRLDLFAVPVI